MSRATALDFVRRFEAPTRVVHWSLAVPFLLLLVTGLTDYVPTLKATQVLGFRLFAWTHVVLGFGLVGIAIVDVLALLRVRSLRQDLGAVTNVTDEDVRWIGHQAGTILGGRTAAPRVGKFNGGQKVNAIASAVATCGLLVTGVILGINFVDKRVFTVEFVGSVFPWHTLLALVMIPVVIGHVYLAAFYPATRESLRGMTFGVVRRDWALRHHPAWHPRAEDGKSGEASRSA